MSTITLGDGSVYGIDPDTGLIRGELRPDPVTDDQVTAQREAATAERYRILDENRKAPS